MQPYDFTVKDVMTLNIINNEKIKIILISLCFGMLLYSSASSDDMKNILLIAEGSSIAFLVIMILPFLLALFNMGMVKEAGMGVLRSAVIHGFILIIPFALLSLISSVFLNWNGAASFSSSGIMICGGAAGMEIIQKGGSRKINGLIPGLISAALSAGWLLMISILGK